MSSSIRDKPVTLSPAGRNGDSTAKPRPAGGDQALESPAPAASGTAAAPAPEWTSANHLSAKWGLVKRIAFRFTFVYLILYTVPILLSYAGHFSLYSDWPWTWITENVYLPYAQFLDTIVAWVGEDVFRIELHRRLIGAINGD